MRFGFVTCVQLGLSCMEAIYDVGGKLVLAMTLEDDMARSKSGRVYLDGFCATHDLDLIKVRNINNPDAVATLDRYDLDWLFIIGWSQIARERVLGAPRRGVIGMHPTLLPIGRGRAAIPWAILKGLDRTGVTMFQLDDGIDTGPIIAQQEIVLAPDVDAGWLYAKVDETHVELMHEVFPRLQRDEVVPQPQDGGIATEWPGRKPEDGAIDPAGSVAQAERLVRAVTRPYPGAFADIGGRRLVVWRARPVDLEDGLAPAPVLEFPDGRLIATDWEWTNKPTGS